MDRAFGPAGCIFQYSNASEDNTWITMPLPGDSRSGTGNRGGTVSLDD